MRVLFTYFFILFYTALLFSQDRLDDIFSTKGEIYFRFEVAQRSEINSFTNIISIDNVIGNKVYAYANRDDFSEFLKHNIKYDILTHPGDLITAEMSDNPDDIREWDVYPTYDAYVNMMNQFAALYPSICTIVEAGTTIQGRKILFAKISDNIGIREAEPQFMFSSSMHGDETTGYVLMLRLIDSLLASYGTDPRITGIVNNTEIWINPLANPDGTYRSGNHTVTGAVRGNALLVDINRNFPDPQNGPHPDGKDWQPETLTMMNLSGQHNFVLSANFHGGAEVVNYPWDTWSPLHADDLWFQFVSHLYADTAQANSPASYMSGFNDGITNGYAWYEVNGGRQDYFNYFRHCREVTIEISNTKLLSGSQLPAHWNYNKKSFLTYIENSMYGISGIVTDTSGNPIKALVSIALYDKDSSQVYSHPVTGDYYRMLPPGNYNLTFTAPGFFPYTVSGITTANFQKVIVDVELIPDGTPVELTSFNASVNDQDVILNWSTASELNNRGFEIERTDLKSLRTSAIAFIDGAGTAAGVNIYSYKDKDLATGNYLYRLKQIDVNGSYRYSHDVEVNIAAVTEYRLYQNYPNPFNPKSKIKYSVSGSGFVSLAVFDVLGNEVMNLVNEIQSPGIYEVEIDGSNLSSGIYYYRLAADSFNATRKLIIIK